MNNDISERIYYLDGLRSFLILLVVLVHSSQVYNPSQGWNIYSEHGSFLVNFIVEFFGLLRMPTFFMVAGYFAVISLKRATGLNFLLKRVQRLLIPLLTVTFTLNLLQAYLLVHFGWKEYTIDTYFSHGYWVSHLWFLINLIIYTILSYIFIRYFKTKTKIFLLNISHYLEMSSIYKILFILPLLNIGLLIIFKFTPEYTLGLKFNQIIVYIPYYLFGILLAVNRSLLYKFSNISMMVGSIVVVLSYILMRYFESLNGIEYKIFYYYFKAVGIWFFASFSFTIFKNFLNKKTKILYKISDASYTIYLVHHVTVIIIGLILIKLDLDFIIGLPILFLTVVFISYFFHRKFVLNYSVLQFLLNGKKVSI